MKYLRVNKLAIVCIIVLTTLLVAIAPGCARATFEISNLTISPQEVEVGQSATISVDVTNISEVGGDYQVALRVNDKVTEIKKVTIVAGTTKTVSFTVLEEKPGTYNLSVDGMSGTLTVTPLHTTRIGVGATAYDWFAQQTWRDPRASWDTIDPVPFLAENGFNWLRVGVTTLSTPELEAGHDYSITWRNEFWCSREYALQVLEAGARVGMQLCLFFYLSDQSAHGGKQKAPSGWKDYSLEETADALKQHTFATTKYYKDKGLKIDLYEIGNEIEFGVAGYSFDTKLYLPGVDVLRNFAAVRQGIWVKEAVLLKAAIAGVQQADPEAKIILHISPAEWPNLVEAFFQAMKDFGVSYDFAGLSYYPWMKWHPQVPSPSNYLDLSVEAIAKLGKETIVCEVSFPSSPTPLLPIQEVPGYPFTLEGQRRWVRDFLGMAENNPHIKAVFYFYPDNYIVEDCGSAALFIDDEHPKPAMDEFEKFQSTTNSFDNKVSRRFV